MEEQSQTWQNWLAFRVSDAFVVGLGWEDKDAIRLRYILWKETLQRHLATLVTFPRHKMSISKCMLMHSTPKWNMPSGDACIFCPAASTSSLPQLTARLTLSRQEGRKERKKEDLTEPCLTDATDRLWGNGRAGTQSRMPCQTRTSVCTHTRIIFETLYICRRSV